MKAVLVGVGQAGGKLAQAIAEYDYRMGFEAIQGALAVNTAKADLQSLSIPTMLVGQNRVKGHGTGADNELGASIMQEELSEVMDGIEGDVTASAEALFVIAGLGGGTGSGGMPVICRALREVYDLPVYAIGILPGRDEGSIYQVNAGRSLRTVAREADSLLLIDNDAWHDAEESVVEAFDTINEVIAQRLGLLLAAGEVVEGVGESVVDSSEVINTLDGGGIAAIGYASGPASEEAGENINLVTSLARRAVMTNASLPEVNGARTGLVVVAGDPERIPRKGVEAARRWLEDETGSMAVRGGDFPLDSEHIAVIVLLGGVEKAGRLRAFMERAKEASERRDVERADPKDAFRSEELEDLF